MPPGLTSSRPHPRCLTTNSSDAAVQVVATEGPLGLYSGLPVQLIGIMPVVSVQLLTNDALSGLVNPVLAGMLTGMLQVIVSNPFEATKVRLQLQGACSNLPALLSELGPAGLYRGWQGCAARDVTLSTLTFPTYAYAKGALAAAGVVGPGALLLCGILAASQHSQTCPCLQPLMRLPTATRAAARVLRAALGARAERPRRVDRVDADARPLQRLGAHPTSSTPPPLSL